MLTQDCQHLSIELGLEAAAADRDRMDATVTREPEIAVLAARHAGKDFAQRFGQWYGVRLGLRGSVILSLHSLGRNRPGVIAFDFRPLRLRGLFQTQAGMQENLVGLSK